MAEETLAQQAQRFLGDLAVVGQVAQSAGQTAATTAESVRVSADKILDAANGTLQPAQTAGQAGAAATAQGDAIVDKQVGAGPWYSKGSTWAAVAAVVAGLLLLRWLFRRGR